MANTSTKQYFFGSILIFWGVMPRKMLGWHTTLPHSLTEVVQNIGELALFANALIAAGQY